MADFIEKDDDLPNYKYFSVDRMGEVFFPKATYKDYKRIPDDIHCELIDGVFYVMASPDEVHQWISGELFTQLKFQLQGKKCTPYYEFDVRLFYSEDESDVTTVRPDLIVVCDKTKVRGKKSCEGVPDFIIEIMSSSSQKRDFEEKKAEYEKAGVKEYWIVAQAVVHMFLLAGNAYTEHTLNLKQSAIIESSTLDGLSLNFQPVIDEFDW